MAVRVRPRSPFGDLLREALSEQGVTIRELARRLAKNDEFEVVDNKRRMLTRYIKGEVTPGPNVREAIADALDVPHDRFAEDRELEEQFRRLAEALMPLADELLRLVRDGAGS